MADATDDLATRLATAEAEVARLTGELAESREANRLLNRRAQRAEGKLNSSRRTPGYSALWLLRRYQEVSTAHKAELDAIGAAVGIPGGGPWVSKPDRIVAAVTTARERLEDDNG